MLNTGEFGQYIPYLLIHPGEHCGGKIMNIPSLDKEFLLQHPFTMDSPCPFNDFLLRVRINQWELYNYVGGDI